MNNDLSAAQAAQLLGVSLATLYSYVSRGLLAAAGPADASRRKRYARDEVLRLAARRADGKRAGHAVAAAMHWGVPVLETRISGVEDGRLHYRGHDVLALAGHATLEQAAQLLWDRVGDASFDAAPEPPATLELLAALRAQTAAMAPLERAQALLPVLAQGGTEGAPFPFGARLMRLLAAILLDSAPSCAPLHLQAAQAWGLDADGAEVVRVVLVLLADHELNPSAFTARCVASTGAGLAAALSAGLGALSGALHGGDSVVVRTMLEQALATAPPQRPVFLRAWLAGQPASVPGFGHPLYPTGDTRACAIVEGLARLPSTPRRAALLALARQAAGIAGVALNADFALGLMEAMLDLSPSTGPALFALARSAGWVAHALEQREAGGRDGQMIRPRARYVGRRGEE